MKRAATARQVVIRIPEHWAAWQLEWALDFLGQLERRVWSIFEENHLADATGQSHEPNADHLQLELTLDERPGFEDHEIPF